MFFFCTESEHVFLVYKISYKLSFNATLEIIQFFSKINKNRIDLYDTLTQYSGTHKFLFISCCFKPFVSIDFTFQFYNEKLITFFTIGLIHYIITKQAVNWPNKAEYL